MALTNRDNLAHVEAWKEYGTNRDKLAHVEAWKEYGTNRDNLAHVEARKEYGTNRDNLAHVEAWKEYGTNRDNLAYVVAWKEYGTRRQLCPSARMESKSTRTAGKQRPCGLARRLHLFFPISQGNKWLRPVAIEPQPDPSVSKPGSTT